MHHFACELTFTAQTYGTIYEQCTLSLDENLILLKAAYEMTALFTCIALHIVMLDEENEVV